ncbi:chromo domain-containing protein [Hamiltosporidium tvaerminnensis]|uniref:Chromo domain-containing protein n=2 Tax=Hamiltosporidium TaxID=1176354 RepID=A0A4Q9KX53_9MICR|nr:Chromobox protein 5 [Hamiltosporidium tvaerminnensis]TBT98729.1 chromo domain-containing protein [Hamiltosporidium tvaerminnensis]TBU01517.1 chromo domain-containing protein [Hamiltosporidium tvaerminnensis]TBU07378.1 chromo domain-containing protein [Hamiltosporidium magnivora]TBU20957.1 chromo domain-containing protein [Hamiltosporidium tvaerminnensis]
MEDENVYSVEKIMDTRKFKGKKQYLIKWDGYSDEHNTWEYAKDIFCKDLIDEFESRCEKELEAKKVLQTQITSSPIKEKARPRRSASSSISEASKMDENVVNKKKKSSKDEGITTRIITNKWDDKVKRIACVHRNLSTSELEVEIEFTDDSVSIVPIEHAHLHCPLWLLKYYEDNICFSEADE